MLLEGKKIGIGITGSFCTINEVKPILLELKSLGAELYPFVSDSVAKYDTRFNKAEEFIDEIEEVCGRVVVKDIVGAEPFGPKSPLDLMLLFPLTGVSLSKIANGIYDTAPIMAAKTTLRNLKPVVIALYTNDALGNNGVNIFKLINTKNFYFVPFGQDDYIKKPNSMTAKTSSIIDTVKLALEGVQIQPVIIENFN